MSAIVGGRQDNQIDLRTAAGARTGTVTPGNSIAWVFDPQQSRVGATGNQRGLWNMVKCISIEYVATIVRSTGGTTPIYADQFPRCISSVGITIPMFGTMCDPSFVDGMILKEVAEYFGFGYTRQGVNRQPIPGTDGTYTRTGEVVFPFFQGWNPWPNHFNYWLGWLDQGQVEIFVNATAQPFGISGVTITNLVLSCKISTVPASELVIPPFSVIRKYEQAASASSNGPKLINVGDSGGLQGVDDGARLQAMLFCHQTGGFVGSGTADQITAVSMPWRDQAQTQLPWGFFERFLANAKEARLGFAPAVVDVYDNTAPYAMSANPTTGGHLNDISARYTPLVFDPKGGLVSQMQKVKGNYPLDGMTFSATQSNNFRVLNRELKQWSKIKCSEMLSAAGIDPEKVELIPKLGRKNIKPIDPTKLFCLPRSIVQK